MPRPEKISIIHHMTIEGLNIQITKLETNTKVLNRLHFIKHRYSGYSVEKAAEMVGVSHNTGYIWQRRWNEIGYNGLIPRYAGGKPSKLSDEEKEDLLVKLKLKNHWATNEVRNLIKQEYNVEYSTKQIRLILKKFGMKYSKPYPLDYRRPADAEEILKKILGILKKAL